MKRLVSLFIGGLVPVLTACGTISIEIPTTEVTAVPTNTLKIPNTGADPDLVKGRPDGNTFYSMTVTIPPAP